MAEPKTYAEVREAIRNDKRLQHLVKYQLRLMWMTRHERDTAQSGFRMYDDEIFIEDGDLLLAYQRALEVAALTPVET